MTTGPTPEPNVACLPTETHEWKRLTDNTGWICRICLIRIHERPPWRT